MLMTKRRLVLVAMILVCLSELTPARLISVPSTAEMASKSDLVIIATPVSQQDLPGRVDMPNVQRGDTAIPAVQVEATLKAIAVLKGDIGDQTSIRLLYYREANPQPVPVRGAQALINFSANSGKQYLMFLHQQSDGRYAAFSGQADPAFSVKELVPPSP